MGNSTINGIILHNGGNAVIKDNDCTKESNLAILPLYLSDSDNTDVFDYGGVTKTLTLGGSYIADTVAELKTWIESVEALQTGHQDTDGGAPYELIDDLRGTILVKVLSFNSPWREGNPTVVNWTLKIVQSSTNA